MFTRTQHGWTSGHFICLWWRVEFLQWSGNSIVDVRYQGKRCFGLNMSFILSLNGWVDWVYILSQPGFSQCSKVKIRIDILELEKVWNFLIIEMLSGEYLGEVSSPQRCGDSQGTARTLCSRVPGLYVRLRRLPGPQRVDLRAVGLTPAQPDLAPGVPGRTCSWPQPHQASSHCHSSQPGHVGLWGHEWPPGEVRLLEIWLW